MEVDTGSRVNCTSEYYGQLVEPTAEVAVIIKPVVETQNISDLTNDYQPPITDENVSPQSDATPETHTSKYDPPGAPETPTVSPPTQATKNVGKYRLLRTIGKGNFAKVKLAIHMATGVEVAIKIINKTAMDSTLLKRLKREITIMKMTNHPNIVRLLEIIENEDVLCLVMEYASGGEIFDYLVANGKMREKEARVKFRQLISAIQYCHSKRIVHRDLKAENILLDCNLNVKVADFGLANTFEHDQRLNTFCGSPPYAAPELFLGIPYYGPGVDIWSLGVILFTLVLGHLPFDARDLRELRSKIIGLNYSIPKGSVSPECEALLRKLLVLDPKDRSSLKLLMQDKWVNLGYASNEILRPHKELQRSQLDEVRVNAMEAMGFTRADLESSVVNPEFDHVYATYHLLPETPSQFVALYEELSNARPTQLSASTKTTPGVAPATQPRKTSESEQPGTAIGRFSVAPSGNVEGQNSRTVRNIFNGSQTADSQSKNTGGGYISEGIREHHSLTAALPVALKKAFVQMGRTFGGYPVTSTQGTETNSRTYTQMTSTRASNKLTPKQNGGRNVVTAAPVPISASKKSHIVTPQSKRASPGPTVPSSAHRSSSTETTSVTNTLSNTREPAVTQPADSDNIPAVKSEHSKKSPKHSPSTQSSKSSSGRQRSAPVEQSPTNAFAVTSKPLNNTDPSKKDRFNEGGAHSDSKSITSSSTSSGSQDEARVRKLSTSSAHNNAWPSVDSPESTTRCENGVTKSDTESNSPSVQAMRVAASTWSPDGERRSATMSPNPTLTKVPHTVQGNEANVLREEVLRIQGASVDPNSFLLDGSHQNTWSRGVFKALGGFFGPSKPHEHRVSDTSVVSSSLSGPREVRFPWSVHTTSTKSAEELLKNIVAALEVTQGCRYSYDSDLPFLLRCSWAANRPALKPTPNLDSIPTDSTLGSPMIFGVPQHCGQRDDPVHWEMEVCQLPRLHLRGVRLKRIRGSTLQFRPIADLVMKSLHL